MNLCKSECDLKHCMNQIIDSNDSDYSIFIFIFVHDIDTFFNAVRAFLSLPYSLIMMPCRLYTFTLPSPLRPPPVNKYATRDIIAPNIVSQKPICQLADYSLIVHVAQFSTPPSSATSLKSIASIILLGNISFIFAIASSSLFPGTPNLGITIKFPTSR